MATRMPRSTIALIRGRSMSSPTHDRPPLDEVTSVRRRKASGTRGDPIDRTRAVVSSERRSRLQLRERGGYMQFVIIAEHGPELCPMSVMQSRLAQWNTTRIHATWSMEEAMSKADELPTVF